MKQRYIVSKLDIAAKMLYSPVSSFVMFTRKTSVIVALGIFVGFICLALPHNTLAQDRSLQELRKLFVEAESDFKKKRYSSYNQKKKSLGSYPLVAYLEHAEIEKERSRNKDEKIEAFLQKYPNFPLKRQLYTMLFDHYHQDQNWKGIIKEVKDHPESEKNAPCLFILALHRTGQAEEVRRKISKRWQEGRPMDTKCNLVIKEENLDFYENEEAIWQRVSGATSRRYWGTVRTMRRYMDATSRKSYGLLSNLRRNKRRLGQHLKNMQDTPAHRMIVAYTLRYYPGSYIDEAYDIYTKKVKPKFSLSRKQAAQIEYHLGLHLTINNDERGLKVMKDLDYAFLSDEKHEWRIRSAIKFRQWTDVMEIIDNLPKRLKRDTDWIYWHAYAREKVGQKSIARQLYKIVAKERSYYGFLAAERLGVAKAINNSAASPAKGESILEKQSFQRFFELTAIGRDGWAFREWRVTLNEATKDELLYLSTAAYSKGWYYYAILAFTEARYWDDLLRRFPTPYQDEVLEAAKTNSIAPSLVYAIMRTESSFRPRVKSSAGAVGLMQIMPATGKSVIRQTRYKGDRKLTTPKTSIDIGSAYLRQLLNQYQGNLILTIASYNAGPNAVKKWIPSIGRVEATEWIETVPYGETRKYLKRILYAHVIFDWRLGRKGTSISSKLQSISKSS